MVVGDPDRPAALGRLAGQRDVTAERDERPRAGGGVHARAQPVGRQRLGRRAEVEAGPRRQPHRARRRVEPDRAPAGRDARRGRRRARPLLEHQGEVAVVAQPDHGGADRRVDVPVGELGGAERRGDRVEQNPAHGDRPPRGPIDGGELRVVAEAAAGPVDLLEALAQHPLALGQGGGVGHDQDRGGAERGKGRERELPHEPPDEVTGGADELLGGLEGA